MRLRSTRLRSAVIVAAGVATITACTPAGGGLEATASPTPSASATVIEAAPAGTPDPCDAIALERVSEIAGVEMGAGVFDSSLSNDGRNLCSWRPVEEGQNLPRVNVEINWGFPDVAEHRELAASAVGEVREAKSTIDGASGIYLLPGNQTLGMAVGDYFVKVSYVHGTDSSQGERTVALAREVAAFLG